MARMFAFFACLPAPRRFGCRSQAATEQTLLQLGNHFGMIRVRPARDPQISIQARKISATAEGLERIQIEPHKFGEQLQIDVNYRDSRDLRASVLLDAYVPAGVAIQARSEEATIWIEGSQGAVRASSTTGDIQLFFNRPIGAPVKAESQRGNIRLALAAGSSADVFASSGVSISLNGQTRIPGGYSTFQERLQGGRHLVHLETRHGAIDLAIPDSRTAPQLASVPTSRSAQRRVEPAVSDPQPSRPRPAPDVATVGVDRRGPPVLQTPGEARQGEVPVAGSEPTSTAPASSTPTKGEQAGQPTYTMRGSTVDSGYSISMKVEYVNVNVSVRDRSNRSIPNLRKQDFEVFEEGALQSVEKFQSEKVPFSLLLLLDVSGSTSSFMDLIKEASINFTRLINPGDRIAVAVFNDGCRLVQDFTNDRHRVAGAIMGIHSGGGTAVYDALDESITDFLRDVDGRKAIVLFSDGLDNRLDGTGKGSDISFDELFRRIQETETIIYPIFLETGNGIAGVGGGPSGVLGKIIIDIINGGGGPARRRRGGGVPWPRDNTEIARREMQEIADQTGGRMYNPQRIEDLSSAYAQIADDLRIQYNLSYVSSNPNKDGAWRRIRVRIVGRPELVTRHRKGYYARNG